MPVPKPLAAAVASLLVVGCAEENDTASELLNVCFDLLQAADGICNYDPEQPWQGNKPSNTLSCASRVEGCGQNIVAYIACIETYAECIPGANGQHDVDYQLGDWEEKQCMQICYPGWGD